MIPKRSDRASITPSERDEEGLVFYFVIRYTARSFCQKKKQQEFLSMKNKLPRGGASGLIVLLAVVFGFMGLIYVVSSVSEEEHAPETLAYSELMHELQQGHIAQLKITDFVKASGLYTDSYKKDGAFEALIVSHKLFWEVAHASKAKILIEYSSSATNAGSEQGRFWWSLLIIVGLLGAMWFFYRNNMPAAGGGDSSSSKFFGLGKSPARRFAPNSVSITFDSVAGVDEAKADLLDIVDFLRDPKKFQRLGAKVPRGILLSGAPGNGKTMLAKAVAGEAAAQFFSASGSDFVEMYVGVGASRVRDLFAEARKHTPAIIFIDEIDAVGRKRGVHGGGGTEEREQTLNQLLAEMDGFATEHGAVIVLAATNRPDILDKALLRPGRFDRVVEVPYPDLPSREKILRVHAQKVPLAPSVSLHAVAQGTPGFSGADLANLVNEAALIATKANKLAIEFEDFEQARDKVMLGSERRTMLQTPEDKRLTAFHEGGHALLNLLLEKTDPFHKVTIIPRGRALGVSVSLPDRDKYSRTKTEMMQRIQVSLGGLIAERLVFNDQTGGVSSDLENATNIARNMVCLYGMSDLGPVTFDQNQYGEYKHSDKKGYEIDCEIKKIIDICYQEAEALLIANRDKLEILANALLERETICSEEIPDLLGIPVRKAHRFYNEIAPHEESEVSEESSAPEENEKTEFEESK